MTVFNVLGVQSVSTREDQREGLAWYPNARNVAEKVVDSAGISLPKAVGLLAALSPNNRWERNKLDAHAIAQAWQSGGHGDAEKIKVATFGRNKEKALAILSLDAKSSFAAQDSAVKAILSGRKVTAFYNCILGRDAVCIDGHAYAIWRGEDISTTQTPSIGVRLYAQIEQDYRTAAAVIGIPARVLQAITWVTWRRTNRGKSLRLLNQR